MAHLLKMTEEKNDLNSIESTRQLLTPLANGLVVIYETDSSSYYSHRANNIWLSECYNCHEIAVWIHSTLVCPRHDGAAPEPNSDLPEGVLRDYREAASIVNASPRGSAALLRLCIQKLCEELGQGGKGLDDAIAALVKQGLDPRVQRSMDAVRVIGNNAVHPGAMDLRDDVATAMSLFSLVNLVAEKMITVPKHVDEVYESLPQNARDRIERRDG